MSVRLSPSSGLADLLMVDHPPHPGASSGRLLHLTSTWDSGFFYFIIIFYFVWDHAHDIITYTIITVNSITM